MRRGIGRSRPCRFLVTSKLQAIARRKSGGSDVSEPRQDYGRRNIANVARERERHARMQIARKVVGATVAITSNSAIDLSEAGEGYDEEEEKEEGIE